MKIKIVLLLFLLTFKLPAFAQNKIIKYCVVGILDYSDYSDDLRAKISTGKVDSLFSPKDVNLKIQLQKINTLKTSADILNYMSSIGWSFIGFNEHRFIFKKEFDPSELNSIKTQ